MPPDIRWVTFGEVPVGERFQLAAHGLWLTKTGDDGYEAPGSTITWTMSPDTPVLVRVEATTG